ncbi:hypothetical protein E2C01_095243 [Portunus trituberculatus]|uniref:Uncharacterized protein n=1 Tax=Portunus trituberculatus TaxID=210409 RepID=A0A5B7K597_PORTR|nr:hypothetical protein [Portunus trituberculatus]
MLVLRLHALIWSHTPGAPPPRGFRGCARVSPDKSYPALTSATQDRRGCEPQNTRDARLYA